MKFIIQRKTFIGMLFIGLTMLGYVSYKNLKVELYPNAELPYLIVQVSSNIEVDPSYMENQGVIPLEGAIGTLEGVEEIMSTATQTRGSIAISYNQKANLKYAYLKLLEKVDLIKPSLPEGFNVNVVKIDADMMSGDFINLEVRGSGGVDRVRNIVDIDVVPDLENIDGIASVSVFGGREKTVEVIFDEKACEAYGISPNQIRNYLRQNGLNRTYVGQVFDNNQAYYVNVSSEYTSISEIENIVVDDTGNVRLRDISEIFFGVKEVTSYSRVNGLESVTLGLVRDSQVNMIDLSHETIKIIEKLNKDLKSRDVEIIVQSNEAETMEDNINQIINLAMIGGILAIVLLWIFLKNIRLVSVIALAIPISIFTAFNFFYAFDITINSLTLVGMALAIGMLLDNSVVVLENVYRIASKGKGADYSVIWGTNEVRKAIIASTLTTIVVFLPFVFSTNFMIKIIGNQVGVAIISTLLVSLAVALFLVPMITHFYLKRGKKNKLPEFKKVSLHNRMVQVYVQMLKTCMRYPARVIIGSILFFFISLGISLMVTTNTLREVDASEISLYVTMPGGSTLENTDRLVTDLEEKLIKLEEKRDIISEIEEDNATITIALQDDYEDINDRDYAQIKNEIEGIVYQIREADINFEPPSAGGGGRSGGGGGGGGGGNAGLQSMLGVGSQTEKVLIKGHDFEKMRDIAEDIEYYFDELSSIENVSLNISDNRPEIHITFDKQLLSQFGIPLNSVLSELNSFPNEFSSGAVFKQGTDEYDIILKSNEVNEEDDEEDEKTIDDLKQLIITGSSESKHELQNLGEIIYSTGMSTINRMNQEKQIELTYSFIEEVNNSKSLLDVSRDEVDELISGLKLPSGVAVEVIHEVNEFDEFYYLILAAIILIYMILASVFESLLTPFVLLFSVPFAATGSVLLLLITGNSIINANVFIGGIILLGIVVNNGIIYLDYTKLLQKQGNRQSRALLMSGLARLRPILITAITTIVAMIPLAMSKSEYVESLGAPFAITVIGGLSLSTLLTLVLMPTIYSSLEGTVQWFKKLNWKVKILQIILIVGGSILIYIYIDGLLWKMFCIFVAIILIPGTTFFLMTSLRQATTKVIAADEKITIKVQNLVKIYDRDSKFARDWKSGKKIRQRLGIEKDYNKIKDFDEMLWQLPLLGFMTYFIYYYLNNGFWFFVLIHIIYLSIIGISKPFGIYLKNRSERKKKNFLMKTGKLFYKLFFWGFPLFNLVIFQIRWNNVALVIFIAILWYLALAVYTTSNRLKKEKVNINRLTGRFKGFRRRFYSFVKVIPILGKRNNPFRALSSVSLEIGTGMFGLLGPNGAGKTTMMRIICGILEQSYGKIYINGIDTQEKREELQGLIGYLPQEFGTYENMTAYEFLSYQAIMKNIIDKDTREEIVHKVLAQVHMDEHMNEKIGSFSGGMKQRIGIAQILLHLPRILVVDEPTAGLDPRERIRFRNLLVELSRERVVIFSTHIIEDIASSCNMVAVLNKGELKYLGKPVDMTKIAEGKVWQVNTTVNEFEEIQKDLLIISHMQDGDNIRIRCIADKKPVEKAVPSRPLLEDAYLQLLTHDKKY
ncbi:efflux RND transporter permease subunit [Bacteroidota bacterium]